MWKRTKGFTIDFRRLNDELVYEIEDNLNVYLPIGDDRIYLVKKRDRWCVYDRETHYLCFQPLFKNVYKDEVYKQFKQRYDNRYDELKNSDRYKKLSAESAKIIEHYYRTRETENVLGDIIGSND